MRGSSTRMARVLMALVWGTGLALGLPADEPAARSPLPEAVQRQVDFAKDIQPILQKSCYSCHGPEKEEGGLRLDDRRRAVEGGDAGPAFLAGKSAESRLVQLVAGIDEDVGRMPPDGEGTPLTADQIGLLRAWIDQGANWPESHQADSRNPDLWSLQPLRKPVLPAVGDASWVLSGLDPFVLAGLESQRMVPSPPADRSTLLRRLCFDLLGLPPTPDQIEQFLSDESPDAYERLVDRLLASPHFGERWGRHWLDLARYADSDGYEKDRPRPFAWRYREWVLAAINADLPYSQFTREQLAGDLLPGATIEQRVASGFHRNTLHNTEGGADPEEDRFKKTVDRTNTFGTTWLGLTVGCAQCHSHKYDSFTQREYYQLYAFFNNLEETDISAPLPTEQEEDEVADVSGEDHAQRGPEPPATKAQAVAERAERRDTHLLIRGDFLNPGERVQVTTPSLLPPLRPRGELPDRLDLAQWLMSDENPLPARVAANRVWQRLFGRGLVATVDDFGKQGSPPTHPELLDWLAFGFREHTWSLKHLVREIVLSATYRQSSAAPPELLALDPDNQWLARQQRRRLEAEVIRDAALAVSGLFDARIGGPSVRPPQPAEYSALTYANSAQWTVSEGGDRYRRGLYTFFQRTSPYPMLMTFDAPDSMECAARRESSNTPLQALALWNDPAFFECAQALGRQIVRAVPAGDDAEATNRRRAVYAMQRALGRQPSSEELPELLGLFTALFALAEQDPEQAAKLCGTAEDDLATPRAELAGWILTGRTLMNLDEFITCE